MILDIENWYLGYSQILKDCRASGGSVQLFGNADADSLAAARIITFMLRNDGIPYQLLPCRSYSQLYQYIVERNDSNDNDSIRAILLLNLGATRNLTNLFMSSDTDDTDNNSDSAPRRLLDPSLTKVYVLDCRRPVHLANIHASNNVVVFWDVQDAEEVPSDGDNLSGNDSSSSEEEESGDDDDEEDSLDGENQFDGDDDQPMDHDAAEAVDYPEDDVQNDDDATNPALDDSMSSAYDAESEDDAATKMNKNKKRRKTLLTVANTPTSSIEDVGNDDDDDGEVSSSMHPATDDATSVLQQQNETTEDNVVGTQRDLLQDRRSRIRTYYTSGTFYGCPASFVTYQMATQLRFGSDNSDLLWLACVGVTDAYLHSRLDVSGYTTLALQLRNHVNRLFPNDDLERVTNTVYAEHLLGTTGNTDSSSTRIGFSGNGRILTEPDFRFFLLRHFSLYDAMIHSDYMSTKFQLSSAQGMHRLNEMLAKMGFPLVECQQPFAFMKPKFRRQLHAKFLQHSEEYNLENIEFTSFFRITGYQSLLSASDTSYAVTALLEYDSSATSSNDDTDDNDRLLQSFNIALDALNANANPNTLTGDASSNNLVNGGALTGSTGLAAGIRLAMVQQKSIMATAFSLIDRTAITRLNHFRYAYITCTSQSENGGIGNSNNLGESSKEERMDHVFAKPLTLTRLAHYLMDLHRENGKWTGNKARPLVLLAEKPRTQSYVVVGYEYPENSGDILKNRFGKNFELAAQSMKGTFLFDSFDSNVVEVARGDVQRFIEQLHYLMETLSKSSN